MMLQTKAHTQQPAQKHGQAQQQPKDMGFVLAWLLLPAVLVCLAVYKWRTVKARMGYRTVEHHLTPRQRELLDAAEDEYMRATHDAR